MSIWGDITRHFEVYPAIFLFVCIDAVAKGPRFPLLMGGRHHDQNFLAAWACAVLRHFDLILTALVLGENFSGGQGAGLSAVFAAGRV